MKTFALGLSAFALVIGGSAYAQTPAPGQAKARPDANKTITRAEAQSQAAARFAKLDSNGDGKLDRVDWEAHAAARKANRPEGEGERKGGRRGGGMMGMARMADTNNDGAISQAEFVAAALKRFDAMDTNKDGTVTPQERQAAREQMKAKWQQMRAQKTQN